MKELLLITAALLSQPARAAGNSEVLARVWEVGASEACTAEARSRFDPLTFDGLRASLSSPDDRGALKRVLAPFLRSLGLSHTDFFTRKDETYYLFKSPAEKIVNPGLQVGADEKGYYVRSVLDGFPAHAAGVRRGDRILRWNGKPFEGDFGREPLTDARLTLRSGGRLREARVSAPSLDWPQAFQDATRASVRVLRRGGLRLGYVHLWSGVHSESARALWDAVAAFGAARVDGVILDLRGGYGGAFWEHLDPFFRDRRDYFVANVIDKEGLVSDQRAEPRSNPGFYGGPLAVLIDEGTRSGKEAMAFQFRKSSRATLVGAATAGYFTAGRFFFAEEPEDYVLYLCVARTTLDGAVIEGVGVAPHLSVPFTHAGGWDDSQLEAAADVLRGGAPRAGAGP